MQNEETTNETQVEQQEGQTVEEETTEEITEETQSESTEETPEAKLAKAEAEAAKYRRLFEKSQKQKSTVSPQKNINNPVDDAMIEKKILKSQGMSDELLGELETIAKVRGKGLIDSQTDPIFIALKDSKEAEAKSAKAKLGASKGSGTVKPQKGFNTPGLSDEEHKEMWRQSQGR